MADEPEREQPELDPEVPEERVFRGRRPRAEAMDIPPGARTIRALRDRKKIIE